MRYEGMIYRPPSEARSLIVQLTVGCAHNSCTFCTMYKDKKFHIRPLEDVLEDLAEGAVRYGSRVDRIFLADGDALVLDNEYLVNVLDFCKERYPYLRRVTSYGTAKDVLRKTPEELKELKAHGLAMVYMGAESGDPEVLKDVKKNITIEEMALAANALKEAGIALSLTLISGLGGKEKLESHALKSAELVTKMKPEYLGFLTLMLEPGAPIMEDINSGKLTLLGPADVVKEMRIFLENVDSEGTVFRSNHASNYVSLAGNLNTDIPHMLKLLDKVEQANLYKDESWRAL